MYGPGVSSVTAPVRGYHEWSRTSLRRCTLTMDLNIKVIMGECMSRARTVKHHFVCVRCSTLNTVGCWEKGNFESYVVTWCPIS